MKYGTNAKKQQQKTHTYKKHNTYKLVQKARITSIG